jgi:ubiquinone/menaquinone biosynthesis C-methylase UbiE
MHQFFDSIVDIYDDTRGLPKDTMTAVIDAMIDELKDCERILELGVGTGRFAGPLQRRGLDVVGIDISSAMLGKARSKGLEDLVMGDACSLPFKDSSFDSIISIHLLHLVEDCENAIREMKRVARKELLSVLYTRSDFEAMEEYKEALNKCGYYLRLPGILEKRIKDFVHPKREIQITPFEDMHTIRERLRLLEERKHSYTTSVPAQFHECGIRYLREKFHDRMDSHYSSEIELVSWDLTDLPAVFAGDRK